MTPEQIQRYVVAGKATFTLQSPKTGTRYTYRVRRAKDKDDLFFVGLLRGADNENDYAYMGVVADGALRATAKSRVAQDAPSWKALDWFLTRVNAGSEAASAVFVPSNRCARCGRLLTVPASVHAGLGPECARRM
jgi:hypothetical protein